MSVRSGTNLRSVEGGLGGIDNGVKAAGVCDCNFTQHLAIEPNIGLLAAVDKPAVADLPLSAGGAQAGYPQASEIPLAKLSTDAGIDSGPDDGLFGQPVKPTH